MQLRCTSTAVLQYLILLGGLVASIALYVAPAAAHTTVHGAYMHHGTAVCMYDSTAVNLRLTSLYSSMRMSMRYYVVEKY
jgi:hypothetical protein